MANRTTARKRTLTYSYRIYFSTRISKNEAAEVALKLLKSGATKCYILQQAGSSWLLKFRSSRKLRANEIQYPQK